MLLNTSLLSWKLSYLKCLNSGSHKSSDDLFDCLLVFFFSFISLHIQLECVSSQLSFPAVHGGSFICRVSSMFPNFQVLSQVSFSVFPLSSLTTKLLDKLCVEVEGCFFFLLSQLCFKDLASSHPTRWPKRHWLDRIIWHARLNDMEI